jgi:hypothetical protein
MKLKKGKSNVDYRTMVIFKGVRDVVTSHPTKEQALRFAQDLKKHKQKKGRVKVVQFGWKKDNTMSVSKPEKV